MSSKSVCEDSTATPTTTAAATPVIDKKGIEEELSAYEMGLKHENGVNWDRIRMPKKTGTLVLLERMIKSNLYPDVTIEISDKSFPCHMIALQAYSKFFYDLGNASVLSLPAEKVTPAAFKLIYEWIISDKPRVQQRHLLEVVIAAKFLKISELTEQCWACLESERHFSEDKAFVMYLESRARGENTIQDLMMNRVSKFFLTIVACKEFLDLDVDEVVRLLKLNTIGIHSESEVFFSAVRWLFYDWEKRQEHLLDVMQCVRFGLTSPWLLFELKGFSSVPEFREIMQDVEVNRMVKEGIEYTLSRFFHKQTMHLEDLMAQVKLNEPTQRMWIKDTQLEDSSLEINFWLSDYEKFLKYLAFVQEKGAEYWKTLEYVEKPSETEIHNDAKLIAALERLSQSFVAASEADD